MPRVLFRTDAGPGIGAGHMMRCLALAEAVHACGGSTALLTAAASPLPQGWSVLGTDIHAAEMTLGGAADLSTTMSMAKELGADWLIADGYHFATPWLDEIGRKNRLLYLDDLGDRDAAATIVLNQNTGAESRYRNAYRRSRHSLLGLDWFLLSSAWRNEVYDPMPRRLLLTLGGADSAELMLALMHALLEHGADFVADVIITAPPGESTELWRFAREHADHFIVRRGPVPLPPLMKQAAVVICGGGVTPIEALSLGTVPVIIILAENQAPGSRHLAGLHAACAMTPDNGGIEVASRLALELLDDAQARTAMATKGRGLVDGKGAERVVQVMMGEIM